MPLPAGIKNIIFDLGGVILNLDYQRTIKAFEELGMEEFTKVYSQANQKHLFDEYEKGLTSSEEFRKGLCALLQDEIPHEKIDAAWNAMLLDLPAERLELLKRLKKKYRLFLLSNTNDIHYTAFSAYLQRTFGFPDFSQFFEKEYYSHRARLRKPDVEVFEMVINENKLLPAETLFIDDTLQHIEGAKRAGLHAYHLQAPETIIDVFGKETGL
jgi:putative hydrolase of the HAD superfamily